MADSPASCLLPPQLGTPGRLSHGLGFSQPTWGPGLRQWGKLPARLPLRQTKRRP